AQMIREAGMHLPDLPRSEFDAPFGDASGSGIIFGVTGGVMESALRTVIEVVTGEKVETLFEHADIIPVRGFEECRLAEIRIPDRVGPVPPLLGHIAGDWKWLTGVTLRVGVAHGTANARKVMEDIKAGGIFSTCHFIEFMACPGGCLGGGGQPSPANARVRAARARAIYAEDTAYGEAGKARKSHENPAVLRVYEEFLTDGPCGHRSHTLLHTHYTWRGTFLDPDA
ncbi:MAG: hydrogenase, partial [Desulfovibrio sp.]|nr:hydrogenase [Desulfovibrio sp.]